GDGDDGAGEVGDDGLLDLAGLGGLGDVEPVLGGQILDDGLDDVVGDAEVHRAGAVGHLHFEADDDDDFVGRDDLHELRVALAGGDGEVEGLDAGPGFGEGGEATGGHFADEARLDLREGA